MSSERPTPKQRRVVEERAQHRCEYCVCPAEFAPQTFNVDHVIPLSKGGKTTLDNLALACGCNNFKAKLTHALDPKTNRVVPLFNPRRQKWSRHFAWSDDYLRIIGLSAIGRATIEALKLNRKELVNLRGALLLSGDHPPKTQ